MENSVEESKESNCCGGTAGDRGRCAGDQTGEEPVSGELQQSIHLQIQTLVNMIIEGNQ